jgi:hypothetical protein
MCEEAECYMKYLTVRSIISIVIGVVLSLALFTLVAKSPYLFGIGLVVGVFLARPSTKLAGSIYGVVIALLLGIYLIYSNSFHQWIANELLETMVDILLLVAFGGLYGAVLVWAKQRFESNKPVYF